MRKLFWLFLWVLLVAGCQSEGDQSPKEMTEESVKSPTESTEVTEPLSVDEPMDQVQMAIDVPEELKSIFQGDWGIPGMVTMEGYVYESPAPHQTTGERLNVLDYGAVPDDPSVDNSLAIQRAIDVAKEGDEVYIPAGTFYLNEASLFSSSFVSHLTLRSGINLIGEGKDVTFLMSNFTEEINKKYKTSIILARSESNIVIADMTLTSNTDDAMLPDPEVSNLNTFVPTAPVYGIVIDNDKPVQQHGNIYVQNILVEKFQRTGIRIRVVHDVVVEGCTIQKATDLGSGGAGYGIAIQGMSNGTDLTGSNLDSVHNVVRNCELIGPYLRHGILLQYYAHNNLITNNKVTDTLLDAIDLHGEDEYSNEVAYNTITNTRKGAGIGLGNTGATHDATGPRNYIHHNTITEGDRGIDILYGTENSVIMDNYIGQIDNKDATGILMRNAHGSYIKNNVIEDFSGEASQGIEVLYAYNALSPEVGVPDRITLLNNTIKNVQDGIYVEAHTEAYVYEQNQLEEIRGVAYLDEGASFVVPPISDVVIPRIGNTLLPTDDNFITNEKRVDVQSQKNMKFKASYFDVPYNRMIYVRFDLTEAPMNKEKVYLRLTGKSKDGLMTINIYGTEHYNDWTESTLTWENALYHDDQVAMVKDDDGVLDHVTDFTFTTVGQDFSTYYIDITDYVKQLKGTYMTLILSNDLVENMYGEIYSKEASVVDQQLCLLFSND